MIISFPLFFLKLARQYKKEERKNPSLRFLSFPLSFSVFCGALRVSSCHLRRQCGWSCDTEQVVTRAAGSQFSDYIEDKNENGATRHHAQLCVGFLFFSLTPGHTKEKEKRKIRWRAFPHFSIFFLYCGLRRICAHISQKETKKRKCASLIPLFFFLFPCDLCGRPALCRRLASVAHRAGLQ